MKYWKDQLRDLKNALLGSGRGKERSDAPPKIDFEPPPAWLAGGRSSPKKSPVQIPLLNQPPRSRFQRLPTNRRHAPPHCSHRPFNLVSRADVL